MLIFQQTFPFDICPGDDTVWLLKLTLTHMYFLKKHFHSIIFNESTPCWSVAVLGNLYYDMWDCRLLLSNLLYPTTALLSLLHDVLFTLSWGYSVMFESANSPVCVCSCSKGNSSTVTGSMSLTSPIKLSVCWRVTAGSDGNTTLTTWDRFVARPHIFFWHLAFAIWQHGNWSICMSCF